MSSSTGTWEVGYDKTRSKSRLFYENRSPFWTGSNDCQVYLDRVSLSSCSLRFSDVIEVKDPTRVFTLTHVFDLFCFSCDHKGGTCQTVFRADYMKPVWNVPAGYSEDRVLFCADCVSLLQIYDNLMMDPSTWDFSSHFPVMAQNPSVRTGELVCSLMTLWSSRWRQVTDQIRPVCYVCFFNFLLKWQQLVFIWLKLNSSCFCSLSQPVIPQ